MGTIQVPLNSPRGGMPSGLYDPSGSSPRPIDNGKAGRGTPIRVLEYAGQHLGAARKVSCGGCCRGISVAGAATLPYRFRLGTTEYSQRARVSMLYFDDGIAAGGTKISCTITSTTDATGVTFDLSPARALITSPLAFGTETANIDIGTGSVSDFGDEEVVVTFTVPAAVTFTSLSVTIEPIPEETISV